MTVVVDASVALSWAYDDEETSATREVLDEVSRGGGWVPAIWRLEVASGLQNSVRRGRVGLAFRDRAIKLFGSLNLMIDAETNDRAWARTLELAGRFDLTLYDACYLELAARRALPLATLDRELRVAATAESVSLLGI